MARVAIDAFAPTIGYSGTTYTADAQNFELTLQSALSVHNTVYIKTTATQFTYVMGNTYSIPSNKTILGQVDRRPVLRLTSGTNKTMITNADAGISGFTSNVKLKNLIIDQQGLSQTAGGGIVVTGIRDWIIEDVVIKKSYRFNFLSLHQSAGISNSTGTVTFTKNSTTVTGLGTLFATELAVGSIMKSAGGQFGRVLTIESNTSLTLTVPWGSATETSVTYKKIAANSGCRFTRVRFEGTVDNSDASGYGFFDDGTVEYCESIAAGVAGCGFVPDHARGTEFNYCVSHDQGGAGFSLETCEDVTLNYPVAYANGAGNGVQFISGTSNCTVNNGKAFSNTNNGYVVTYNTTVAGIPRNNVFANCAGYLNGGYAFRDDGGVATEYSSVQAYNNDTGGIILNASNGSTPDNIHIHDSSFYDDRGTKSQDRGIYIVAATNTLVENNTALDSQHVIAGIVNSGTNTTLTNNVT